MHEDILWTRHSQYSCGSLYKTRSVNISHRWKRSPKAPPLPEQLLAFNGQAGRGSILQQCNNSKLALFPLNNLPKMPTLPTIIELSGPHKKKMLMQEGGLSKGRRVSMGEERVMEGNGGWTWLKLTIWYMKISKNEKWRKIKENETVPWRVNFGQMIFTGG